MTLFTASYRHRGATWGVDFWADDWDDARERCEKLNLHLDGEVIARIPARVGFLAKAACAIRNFFATQ